jgi:hypothetical protein
MRSKFKIILVLIIIIPTSILGQQSIIIAIDKDNFKEIHTDFFGDKGPYLTKVKFRQNQAFSEYYGKIDSLKLYINNYVPIIITDLSSSDIDTFNIAIQNLVKYTNIDTVITSIVKKRFYSKKKKVTNKTRIFNNSLKINQLPDDYLIVINKKEYKAELVTYRQHWIINGHSKKMDFEDFICGLEALYVLDFDKK